MRSPEELKELRDVCLCLELVPTDESHRADRDRYRHHERREREHKTHLAMEDLKPDEARYVHRRGTLRGESSDG